MYTPKHFETRSLFCHSYIMKLKKNNLKIFHLVFDVSRRHHTYNIACGAGSLFLDAALGAKDKLSSYFILFFILQVVSITKSTATSTASARVASSPSSSNTRWPRTHASTWGGCWGRTLIESHPRYEHANGDVWYILKSGIIKIQVKHLNGLKPVLNSLLKHILTKHTPFSWKIK